VQQRRGALRRLPLPLCAAENAAGGCQCRQSRRKHQTYGNKGGMALLCVGGGAPDDVSPEQAKRNRDIKKNLDETQCADTAVIKLLLLGAGESGKSTIFKQMKVINKGGYSDAERKNFQSIVWSNTIVSIKALLGAFQKLEIDKPSDLEKLEEQIEDKTKDKEELDPDLGAIIKQAWNHEAMQEVYLRRNQFQLNDSAEYYLQAIDRISLRDYIPTTDDVLRSRVRTTGIVQSDFKIKATNFSMFDVGGQRNERRKWIHCFDHVNAVVFVAALSEFDQVLFEDETQNRLDEAIDLFKQIINSKWFKETSVILFLNKKDLFKQKLGKKNFADYRKDYTGANTMDECVEYCKSLFIAQNQNKEKAIYCHATTATDTENVKFVFNSVVSIILDDNLKSSGLG